MNIPENITLITLLGSNDLPGKRKSNISSIEKKGQRSIHGKIKIKLYISRYRLLVKDTLILNIYLSHCSIQSHNHLQLNRSSKTKRCYFSSHNIKDIYLVQDYEN